MKGTEQMKDRFKLRVYDKVVKRYLTDNDVYEITDGILDNLYDLLIDENRRFILGKHDLIFELCTGLKDKNGELIYEGDVVSVPEFYNGIPTGKIPRYKVSYKHAAFNIHGVNTEQLEVIGNINENQELLED